MIKRPSTPKQQAVYDGLVKFLLAGPEIDQKSGQIRDKAMINSASWRHVGEVVKKVLKSNFNISAVPMPPRVPPSLTAKDIVNGFLSEMVSGGSVADEQISEWLESILKATAQSFNVSQDEAASIDLIQANDNQISAINSAFSKQVGMNYAADLIDRCRNVEPNMLRVADVLEAIYPHLEAS